MGGRGASSGIASEKSAVKYMPYARGQITRTEAGTVYKAVKNGQITVKPETTKTLYDATTAYIRFANERYLQNHLYYERIYRATEYLLNKKYKKAQREIEKWEEDNISRSSKKSPWYKYKKKTEWE